MSPTPAVWAAFALSPVEVGAFAFPGGLGGHCLTFFNAKKLDAFLLTVVWRGPCAESSQLFGLRQISALWSMNYFCRLLLWAVGSLALCWRSFAPPRYDVQLFLLLQLFATLSL